MQTIKEKYENPNCNCEETHEHLEHSDNQNIFKLFFPAIISFITLNLGLYFENFGNHEWFTQEIQMIWYGFSYIPVGLPVVKNAVLNLIHSDIFSEFFLMTIATIGAFAIGEYPEAVAVMLFYTVGENLQHLAVDRATQNIKNLIDQRPEIVTVLENGNTVEKTAKNVQVGEIIQLKVGEKLGLDGKLISETASFDTSALTGESVPDNKSQNDTVLAGMINLKQVVQVKVTQPYEDSQLSKILELTQKASSQKAPTELFIRKFSKIYTPIVVFIALGICLLPYFFFSDYEFQDWLYRSLIFLVIACPCALVISIPLGYFGGIGVASRKGILIKGGNFLDLLAKTEVLAMDKTGTITEGVFKVQKVKIESKFNETEILELVNVLENYSSHPIATAIHEFVGEINSEIELKNIEEIAGHGLKAQYKEKTLLVGNLRLLDRFEVPYNSEITEEKSTILAIALGGEFVGYITISDQIKAEAKSTIQQLKKMAIHPILLSGDKTEVVLDVAQKIGISDAFGSLLPQDKLTKVQEIKSSGKTVAFVGDGLNDAPVIAISDVGIAMGGLGSDATIETADVVIQDDLLSKIPLSISIGKKTKQIIWQNIALALGIKGIVMFLGAFGIASMWMAIFADTGVAFLAILNALRIFRMK